MIEFIRFLIFRHVGVHSFLCNGAQKTVHSRQQFQVGIRRIFVVKLNIGIDI